MCAMGAFVGVLDGYPLMIFANLLGITANTGFGLYNEQRAGLHP